MAGRLAVYLTRNTYNRNLQHKAALLQHYRNFAGEKSATEQRPAENENLGNSEGLPKEIEKLSAEVESLREKHDTLMDKYKRALADSENMRTRLTKQIADAKIFGIQSFCKDLLEVADTLGHATASVPQDALAQDNPHLKSLYDGLTMTQASLLQIFKRHGLEQINPINEKFDPNVHEALFTKVDPNAKPDTIVEVTKLGYKLHERVIRPALVGVAKAP